MCLWYVIWSCWGSMILISLCTSFLFNFHHDITSDIYVYILYDYDISPINRFFLLIKRYHQLSKKKLLNESIYNEFSLEFFPSLIINTSKFVSFTVVHLRWDYKGEKNLSFVVKEEVDLLLHNNVISAY